jgi:hypothetical protein
MAALTLDMCGCRIASANGPVLYLGSRLEYGGTEFLTFAEHPAVQNGALYAIHVQDGRGWMRASAVYDKTANALTIQAPVLALSADGAVQTAILSLSSHAFVTAVQRAEDLASQAVLQAAVDASAISASQAADSASAAQTAAEAAEAAAEVADPSDRVLRAGDTMGGALNFKMATVASHATTAPIWAGTGGSSGNLIDFTGTATITDFPDAPQAGAERALVCAGACTFTNNGNIAVQGGRNYTAEAGDIVVIRALTVSTFKATIIRQSDVPLVRGTAGLFWGANGTGADASFQAVPNFRNIEIFTTSGTFTKPATVGRVWRKIVDGGQGGYATATGSTYAGAGGKGGDVAEGFEDITGNVTVTVGSGGAGGIGGQSGGAPGAGGLSSFGSSTTASPGAMSVKRAGKTPQAYPWVDPDGGSAGDGSNSNGKGGTGVIGTATAGSAGIVIVMY